MRTFLVALGFLTRIPVDVGSEVSSKTLSKSVIYFPLIGGIIGLITAGIYLVLAPFLPRTVLSVIIVSIPIFITGGIHFDGLLDTCDGVFSGRSRERSLEIMRDSRVGSMGVIAGILNIILRYSILLELSVAFLPMIILTQTVCSRWIMTIILYFFPYARSEGKGLGFNAHKSIYYIILSTLLAWGIMLLANGLTGIVIALLVLFITIIFAFWVMGKLGGMTGDVYGALNEVGEISFLILWLVWSVTLL